jgi:hypothetical protein
MRMHSWEAPEAGVLQVALWIPNLGGLAHDAVAADSEVAAHGIGHGKD